MADSDVTNVRIRTSKYVEWDWLSDGSGDYSQDSVEAIDGVITRAVFIPDSGDTAPTDAYDVVLTDEHSVDVLHSLGANRSGTSTNNLELRDELSSQVSGLLTLTVSNAGAANGGTVRVYYKAV